MHEIQKDRKIINNAISAYFMIFVSGFFLLNKDNPYLNNDFVKGHTRWALTIHFWFFLSYFIFIYLWVWNTMSLFWINLNIILASVSCIVLLFILVFWMYRAQKAKDFRIWEFLTIFKVNKIQASQSHHELEEREKMNFIVAHIPFIGFVNYAKNSDKEYIQDATKLNLLITVLFIIFYGFGYVNFSHVLLLIYTIYIVFVGLNIFSTHNVFTLNLKFIPAPEKKYFISLALGSYIKDYFSSKSLQSFDYYYNFHTQKALTEAKQNYHDIQELKSVAFFPGMIYVPIVNLICVFQKNKMQKFHIINGIILSLMTIVLSLIIYVTSLSEIFILLLMIAYCYAYGYLKYNPVYKMPYVYMFYTFWKKVLGKSKKFNKTYNVEKEIHLKIKE